MTQTITAKDLDTATLDFGLLVGLLLPLGKEPEEYELNQNWLRDPVAQLRKRLETVSDDLKACLRNAVHSLSIAPHSKETSSSADELVEWNPLLFPAVGFGGHVGDLGEVPAVDWLSLIANGGDVPETLENWVQRIAGDQKTLKAWGAALAGLVTGDVDEPKGTGTSGDPYLFALREFGNMGTLYLSLAGKREKNGSSALIPGLAFDSDPINLTGKS
ncbi:hypothetical protein [Pseudovibrio sp. Tun.PSC04-5.I4]|uniref:hypothetical protein n=1 Tax=Pseudovibrio sp. Tun.PSC04-5.I4 TaxID=1798213 RepID=UPI0008925399|nr:hypothetical protein [Pseudovibrio sp. Tun.PSC04-5.I4]SDR38412.1 hypothetical protein SAMN04515695_5189 [Pseudovibrio sp. Tun.PSC04-5.I4]